jgi:D-galactarolactone cycloisomerase
VGISLFGTREVAPGSLAQHCRSGTQNQTIAALAGIDIAAHEAMGKLFGVAL